MRRVGPWIWANPDIQNPVLPATDAETVCNQLPLSLMTDGGISEATNAEKSILFQGRLDRQNFCLLSPKHCWWWKNLLCVKILFFFLSLFRIFFFCILHLFAASPALLRLLHCGERLCQGNDSRREWWKAAVIERSWATKIWSNIYTRAAFERPQWHSCLTIKFWVAGPTWKHKAIHTQHLKSVWRRQNFHRCVSIIQT